MKKVIIGLALGLSASFAYAEDMPTMSNSLPPSGHNLFGASDASYATAIPSYYSFKDSAKKSITFSNPTEIFQEMAYAVKTGIDLLNWTLHAEEYPAPSARYQRLEQFGRWINDPTDDTCMNTRAQVLVRDSEVEVKFRAANRCIVQSGQWLDPYAGDEMTESKEVQIDHVVPLKNAYVTGASKWDLKTRKLYANFMGVDYHLLPVNGHENMSKGDKGPDAYIPPNEKIRCDYLQHWLKIKAVWNLVMTKAEAETIQKMISEAHCQPADFRITAKELSDVRAYIKSHLADMGN